MGVLCLWFFWGDGGGRGERRPGKFSTNFGVRVERTLNLFVWLPGERQATVGLSLFGKRELAGELFLFGGVNLGSNL